MGDPKLVRYFSLAGAVDADPIILQPAADAFGPLVTGLGGSVLVVAWEVDGEGLKVSPTGGLVLTVGIVTNSKVQAASRPPGASLAGQPPETNFWARGPLAANTEAGEWRIQADLMDPAAFQVVVTAKAKSPATWLAIWATRGPL